MDDSSDILGGQLHIAKHGSHYPWSNVSITNQLLIVGTALLLAWSFQQLYPSYKQYQERRYRKQMRRRHGIPDSDHRPFNVAYAAASKTRLERDAGVRNRSRLNSQTPQTSTTATQQRAGSVMGQAPGRQRYSGAEQRRTQTYSVDPIPGGLPRQSAFVDATMASETDPHHNVLDTRDMPLEKPRPSSSSSLYQPAFARAAPLMRTESEIFEQPINGKRRIAANTSTSEKENKRSRVEDDDITEDFDQTAEWQDEEDEDMDVDRIVPSSSKTKRGSKRMASLNEDGFEFGRPNRDKRARRTSGRGGDESMEQDVESNTRGKKRDRTSYGTESHMDEEDDKAHRHRRRRVVSHKKTSESSRGQKRGRDADSMESDEDSDSPSRRAVRHKRGKKTASRGSESAEEALISNDPLCKGRHIGEEWEINGIHYKVGPNGQRLRQALVKQTRSRFPMPQDSEHPDASVHIDVFVESWLSEEQYQAAKERQELAWQQSPTRKTSPVEPSTASEPETPTKGKNLLWSSTALKDAAPRKGVRQALTSSGSLRVNPFQPAPTTSFRRISTLQSAPTPDTPKMLRSVRSYSKWEKQDLEAAAMAKLREKVKQEAAPSPEKTTVPVAPAATMFAAPPAAAASAGSKPAASTEAPKASPFAFGTPSTNTNASASTKASTNNLPALTIPSSDAPKASSILFPSKPTNAPTEAPKAAASSSAPSTTFSFAKPAQVPTAASNATTTTAPTGIPNFFGNSALGSGSSSATANIFGPTAQKANPAPANPTDVTSNSSTAQTAKPVFSWAPPAAPTQGRAEEKPAQVPAPAAPSLLSRLGGFSAPAQPGAGTNSSSATAAAPTISFAKPSTTAPAPAPAPTPASAPSTTSTVPQFSFGFAPKAESSAAAPTSTGATTTGAAKPTFSFGAPQPSTAQATGSKPEPPKFSFGVTSGPSGSGATAAPSASGSTPAAATTPSQDASSTPKPTFTFGASAFSTPPAGESKATSVFGNTTTPAGIPKFSFGATTTPAGEPKTGSIFGNTTTPAGEPKTSLFGNSTTPAGPPKTSFFGNTTTPAGEPKTASVFGNTTTPAGEPKTASVFGNTTTPAGEPKTTSAFGPTTTQAGAPKSAFGGFGSGSAIFGQPTMNAAGSSSQPAESAKSPFAFGAPSFAVPGGTGDQPKSAFSSGTSTGTNGSATSSTFSFGASSTPATSITSAATGASAFGATFGAKPGAPTPSAFGFGTPTGTFSFGKTNNDSTQK